MIINSIINRQWRLSYSIGSRLRIKGRITGGINEVIPFRPGLPIEIIEPEPTIIFKEM